MMIINKLSKESTLQYTLTLIDDVLQENKMRVDLFHTYGRKHKENVYQTFLKMLNMQDAFINHQTSRIVTKLACWGNELMSDKELKDYFMWMKDHLEEKVFIFDLSLSCSFQTYLSFRLCWRIRTRTLCVDACKWCSESIITELSSTNWTVWIVWSNTWMQHWRRMQAKIKCNTK